MKAISAHQTSGAMITTYECQFSPLQVRISARQSLLRGHDRAIKRDILEFTVKAVRLPRASCAQPIHGRRYTNFALLRGVERSFALPKCHGCAKERGGCLWICVCSAYINAARNNVLSCNGR